MAGAPIFAAPTIIAFITPRVLVLAQVAANAPCCIVLAEALRVIECTPVPPTNRQAVGAQGAVFSSGILERVDVYGHVCDCA